MTELNCESVCMAAMALADGYEPEISRDQIEAHLANCPACREEVGQLRSLATLLGKQQRRQSVESIWPAIKTRLPQAREQGKSSTMFPFIFLGVLLAGYKLVELAPDRDFGLLFKLAPIIFIVAAFSLLKQNPFEINSELKLEGE